MDDAQGSYFVGKNSDDKVSVMSNSDEYTICFEHTVAARKNPKSGLMQGTVFVIMLLKEVVHLVIRKQ